MASFDSNRWSEGSETERDLELPKFKSQHSLANTAKEKLAEDHRGCWVGQASDAESVGGQLDRLKSTKQGF